MKYFSFLLLASLVAACTSKPVRTPSSDPLAKDSAAIKIKGIDVVYIHATDKKLADWYEKTLGIKKGYSDGSWHGYDFEKGSRFGVDVATYPRSTMEKQSVVISFEVEDIKAAVQALAKKKVRFYPDVANTISDMGSAYVATFEDPDGNYVQLSQKK